MHSFCGNADWNGRSAQRRRFNAAVVSARMEGFSQETSHSGSFTSVLMVRFFLYFSSQTFSTLNTKKYLKTNGHWKSFLKKLNGFYLTFLVSDAIRQICPQLWSREISGGLFLNWPLEWRIISISTVQASLCIVWVSEDKVDLTKASKSVLNDTIWHQIVW